MRAQVERMVLALTHLLTSPVTEPEEGKGALSWAGAQSHCWLFQVSWGLESPRGFGALLPHSKHVNLNACSLAGMFLNVHSLGSKAKLLPFTWLEFLASACAGAMMKWALGVATQKARKASVMGTENMT